MDLNEQLKQQIYALLEEAAANDPECEQFGTAKHRYKLHPPANPETLRQIEKDYSFTYPEDFFWFLTSRARISGSM